MLLRELIEYVTPQACLGCRAERGWLCTACVQTLTMPAPVCFACGRLSVSGRTCERCRRRHSLDGAIVAAHYEGAVRELVLTLKFGRARAAAEPAAELITRALPDPIIARLTGVTAVPVSPGRHRERGYNQSELIARLVAARLGLPYQRVLQRETKQHQLGASRKDRFRQVEQAFKPTHDLAGRWLLIDDVITTGATLEASARALKQAGASAVIGAVVAGQRG